MSIVLALLGAVAAALWAFRHLVDSATDDRDVIGGVRRAFRRGKSDAKIDDRLVDRITDPREAGAVFALQLAAYDGAITNRQRETICEKMIALFQIDRHKADQLFGFARMTVGEINDASNLVRQIAKPIEVACTVSEKAALLEFLEDVAAIEGPINAQQSGLIKAVRRALVAV